MDQTNNFLAKGLNIERDPIDGKKIINGFKILNFIGEGAYGKIKLVKQVDKLDGQYYAIKKFNKFILKKKNKILKNPDGTTKYVSLLSEVYREIQLQSQISQQNIIKIIQVIDADELDKLYIILEYAENGPLLQWNSKTQKFSYPEKVNLSDEEYFKQVFRQCLNALEYLHDNLIIHRDIKPQNILIDSKGDVKICDFGTAQKLEFQNSRLKGTEGTFQFMAPECLKENKNEKSGYLGQQADIWSLGVVMYAVSELRLPFQDDNMLQLFNKIQNDEPEKLSTRYSSKIQEIIYQMLNKDPKKRPSIKQIIEQIQ